MLPFPSTQDVRTAGYFMPANVQFGFGKTVLVNRMPFGHPLNGGIRESPQTFAVRASSWSTTSCVFCGNRYPPGSLECRYCGTSSQMHTPGYAGQDLHTKIIREHQNLLDHFGGWNSNQRGDFQQSQNQRSLITKTDDHWPTNQAANVQDSFHTAYNSSQTGQDPRPSRPYRYKVWQENSSQIKGGDSSRSVYKNTVSQTSFSLDTELERWSCEMKPKLVGQSDMSQGPGGKSEHDENHYFPAHSNSVSSCTEEGILGYLFHDTDLTFNVDSHSANITRWKKGEHETFHSIMEDDESILQFKASKMQEPYARGVHSGMVRPNVVPMASSEKWLPVGQSTAEMTASSLPKVSTCTVTVGSEQSSAPCHSVATQTEVTAKANKHVTTEVRMSDLQYLTEKFVKLELAQEELKELKEKMTSLNGTKEDCVSEGGCDCFQRAKQAELCVLALQYRMCQQHCWKCYYASVEGDKLTLIMQGLGEPPENLVGVLQGLEFDYENMRNKILEGVPLVQLKPLSVDSRKMTTGTCYIPAQIIGETLENGTTRSCQQVQKQDCTVGGGKGSPHRQNCNVFQEGERETGPKDGPAEVTSILSTVNARKELNPCDTWYDAEEDLQLTGPKLTAEMDEASSAMTKDKKDGSATETQKDVKAFLCVADLPSNVAEGDVLIWFEKYHASEVRISTFSGNVRVAVVTVSDFQSAETAVKEMNGCSMQGHALHVVHINMSKAGSHGQQQASSFTNRPDFLGDAPKTQASTTSTSVQLICQQTSYLSMEKPKALSAFPIASGTCVPPHYATMGSFDILVAQLTKRHPDVERKKIVNALLELSAKHHSVLGGLPLKTIGEMISELLFGPTNTTT